jgi:hypothetical protein
MASQSGHLNAPLGAMLSRREAAGEHAERPGDVQTAEGLVLVECLGRGRGHPHGIVNRERGRIRGDGPRMQAGLSETIR